jgi:hypothetical protein
VPCDTNHQADSLASLQDLGRNFGVSSGETCDVATVDTPNDEPDVDPTGESNSGATVAILSSASAVTTLALSLLF